MAGIDEILGIISTRQAESEKSIISSAESKASEIKRQGDKNASEKYAEYMGRSAEKLERDYKNACNSVDAEMKRRVLACKVKCINEVAEKVPERLRSLPDEEYSELILTLVEKFAHDGDGVLCMCERDLKRIPADFEEKLKKLHTNGTISLSKEPAGIEDGFILSYGLISENCSFGAVIESERDAVKDVIAGKLFG